MPYKLLPFRFQRLNSDEVFISNEVGEFLCVPSRQFEELISFQLNPESAVFLDLKSKQVLTDTDPNPVVEMLATKYRTKKGFLNNFTCLHMVVPTLRCNSNCIYCQVSRKEVNTSRYDMDKATAKKVVDMIFCSPSPAVKIEFQGGEPLLNFGIIKYVIEYAEWVNVFKRKTLEFVICTNLTLMTEKMLNYLKGYNVCISTSLDGPRDLHNKNRPLQAQDNNYDLLIEKIKMVRQYLGPDSVAALMTVSRHSLGRFREIVDEYLSQGFHSMFIRPLNPYGFARQYKQEIGYTINEFIDNYKNALNYIIDLNMEGKHLSESFAALLLTRMLTPFSTGFVDMQSPAGVAISGVIYNYNGNVYVSDEGRMLASAGDEKFLMGNVHKDSYQKLFNSEFLHSLIGSSCLECLPECADCAYQSYCGADPVRNYSEQGDIVGHRPTSDLCQRNKQIIAYLLGLLKKRDHRIDDILWSWITRKY